ncbi:NAD(P)/FAD-dependent oxidoreductase [Maritimibacter sp. DP1N21-5]|uniref:NAD(P)/FAD-dependent oxidoreductase n=1 Tax=Maritimibacter sp. DP1N21-5 TaxID=2836867 RepID=UPI001C46B51F|nr:NAD(P)/FAD-dependent oxidoreductase [Maritimibacter sp. DP1N21-5]MBV7408091.1 NAD(P)/FAD-dependent oxidoreductase [Maritimibacter sp. DP1N21-5]
MDQTHHDVIVIGGSYSGCAAALQLLRAHRRVCVIDAGERRNRTVPHSHGFITQDGVDPAALATAARADLHAYPTLTWKDDTAIDARQTETGFEITLHDETRVTSAKLILATGVRDILPDIPGLAERWGDTVAACPYCHGYECAQGPIAVIGTGPGSEHQAQLLAEWGQVDFLTQGLVPLDEAMRADLERREVTIRDTPVTAITGRATVSLSDGSTQSYNGIFTATTFAPSSPIPAQLGCEMAENPMGQIITVDEMQATSVPGVFACGDAATFMASVSIAVGKGALAGIACHRDLVFG